MITRYDALFDELEKFIKEGTQERALEKSAILRKEFASLVAEIQRANQPTAPDPHGWMR